MADRLIDADDLLTQVNSGLAAGGPVTRAALDRALAHLLLPAPTATGTADAIIVVNPVLPYEAWAEGTVFSFVASATNTALGDPNATAISLDELAYKRAVKDSAIGLIDLHAGALVAGRLYQARYDAAADVVVILNPTPKAPERTVFAASDTWTRPKGCTGALVRLVGGGGAGGGAVSASGEASVGAGGAAGGYAEKWIAAGDLGDTETATIGDGGTPDAAGGTGAGGGMSSFGAHLSATGGHPGLGGVSLATVAVRGGAAGGAGTGGDINGQGGAGGTGVGMGGGSGGRVWGGNGGVSAIGGGAAGSLGLNGGVAGGNGISPGSGGAGAASEDDTTVYLGGNGAAGLVIVDAYFGGS